MIERIEDMGTSDLETLERAIAARRRRLHGSRKETSEVIEYRPHADGMLQLDKRIYTKQDGTRTERGPYWYFRYHEGGRQRTLYLGKTDTPEEKLAEKRRGKEQNA